MISNQTLSPLVADTDVSGHRRPKEDVDEEIALAAEVPAQDPAPQLDLVGRHAVGLRRDERLAKHDVRPVRGQRGDAPLGHLEAHLPSGISAFPVARTSEHHRSINQKLPDLWSDFSDRGLPHARGGSCHQTSTFHGDLSFDGKASGSRGPPASAKPGRVLFVGYAEFDMDGRAHTAGEMDRLMLHVAAARYPCSRPATFDEYAEGGIVGLPQRNATKHDVVFVGPGATGCELFHTNTLGAQKVIVHPGDAFDGTWDTASLFGRKSILCVHPVERIRRQQSLTQFGLARASLGQRSNMRKSASSGAMLSATQWSGERTAAEGLNLSSTGFQSLRPTALSASYF